MERAAEAHALMKAEFESSKSVKGTRLDRRTYPSTPGGEFDVYRVAKSVFSLFPGLLPELRGRLHRGAVSFPVARTTRPPAAKTRLSRTKASVRNTVLELELLSDASELAVIVSLVKSGRGEPYEIVKDLAAITFSAIRTEAVVDFDLSRLLLGIDDASRWHILYAVFSMAKHAGLAAVYAYQRETIKIGGAKINVDLNNIIRNDTTYYLELDAQFVPYETLLDLREVLDRSPLDTKYGGLGTKERKRLLRKYHRLEHIDIISGLFNQRLSEEKTVRDLVVEISNASNGLLLPLALDVFVWHEAPGLEEAFSNSRYKFYVDEAFESYKLKL